MQPNNIPTIGTNIHLYLHPYFLLNWDDWVVLIHWALFIEIVGAIRELTIKFVCSSRTTLNPCRLTFAFHAMQLAISSDVKTGKKSTSRTNRSSKVEHKSSTTFAKVVFLCLLASKRTPPSHLIPSDSIPGIPPSTSA